MATLAKLLIPHNAYAAPDASSRKIMKVPMSTAIAHDPTVLLVIGEQDGWFRVRLPKRPNGSTGWIKKDGCAVMHTNWRGIVDLSARTATFTHKGKQKARFSCVIGKPSTPTPTGNFFITEKVLQPKGHPMGPWVLALNGYSNVLQNFGGGPGQIALHGQRGSLAVPLGTAASHGCVRFSDKADKWLAKNLPVGTPIQIKR